MVNKFCYIFIVFSFLSEAPLAQSEEIGLKQHELTSIKDEINQLEEELKQKSKKEKESFTALENYSKQNFLLNKLISKIRSEEKLKQQNITSTEKKISSLEKEIKTLQKNYADYVVAVYKSGKPDELESILGAESIEQALVRYKYLSRFAENRQADLQKFKNAKEELIAAKEILEKERKEKIRLASQKEKEEKELIVKLNERKEILKVIKNDKAELKKELEAKKTAEATIRNLIAQLIEEAERKKREEREKLASISESNIISEDIPEYSLNLSTDNLASFSDLKGKLIWPINKGKIVRSFGENRHSQLKTVTLNYGVDIKAASDENVKAVAEGIVSAIDWIPGYGSVIILTHKDEYRTVYSHLSEIFVKEGDRVRSGSLLAKIGESIEGKILHFEIWNARSNQNPEIWLVKK